MALLICGYERGGTTPVSEILRQHPRLVAGFEGGFLLADEPSEFPSVEPYYLNAKRGWNLDDQDMEYICGVNSWTVLYERLRERYLEKLDDVSSQARIFDKTPKYLEVLPAVLAKMPHVPCVVVVRDPRALLWSWIKREGPDDFSPAHLEGLCARYRSYGQGYRSALEAGFADRLLLVHYESLSLAPERESRRFFDFVGLDYEPEYLSFDPAFPNVRGTTISADYISEYAQHLPAEVQERILELTVEFEDWWWSDTGAIADSPPTW